MHAASLPPGAIVNDRYQVCSVVGEGGMAKVYRTIDLSTGQSVALKQLHPKSQAASRSLTSLFEREFLVLSQLSHPRIVAAYDYGVAEQGPFYTMELLDGSDLEGLAPLDYRKACALVRDVCSALALLHSRRLVYRDVSPHNIRCTAEGLAKLIDFGALAPMGPHRDLVGTLPCVAPEVVARQPLDARTDLYALGATLYHALVRRHAYPAHSLEELVASWQQRPRAPSQLVPGIPPALDTLIGDLLEADPARRPQSAAEVMERLRAIGGLEPDDSLLVRSSYLSKPSLVGREHAIRALHEQLSRAKEGHGRALRIVGPSGAGLSRLLESFRLEAKLKGWLVLDADAGTADSGDYALAALLGRSLLRQLPHLARTHAAPHVALLGSVIPELLEGRSDVVPAAFETPEARHRKLQPAFRQWFARVAEERPLLAAIDDIQRADGPSASFLALLASERGKHRLTIVVTQPDDQPYPIHHQRALRLLARVAQPIALAPFSPELTQSVLGSVFGEVPNLELVSRHVQQITGGKPRDILALAQHLVAEGVVRYEAGSWVLPNRLSPSELPPSIADGLKRHLRRLTAHARIVAYAISREPGLRFSFADGKLLLPDASPGELTAAFHVLVDNDVLSASGDGYRCHRRSWNNPLAQALSPDEKRAAHLGLAQVFRLRGDGFRQATWLLRAGEEDEGLTVMTEFSLASRAITDKDPAAFNALFRALPDDWLEICEQALSLYERQRRPARERSALLSRMAGFVGRAGQEVNGIRVLDPLLRQLEQESGLDCFRSLGPDVAPAARIPTALGLAKARYLALPEHERVLDPGAAIKELVSVMVAALGSIATTSDFAAFRSLPSLAPIAPLSPSIQLVHQLAQGLGHRLGARSEDALSVYRALLDRLAQPDHGGLEPAHHFHTKIRVMGAVGTLEAMMGRASCLGWAEQLDGTPQYEHVGMVIPYLYHLWQGNGREAREARRRFELLQLEIGSSTDMQYIFSELCFYALTGDMTGVRRAADALESLARPHLAARAALHYARGEYQRIRGDLAAALHELEQALALMKPGEHLVWANAAGAHLRVLSELGRHEDVRAFGEAYLAVAEAQQLGYVKNYIRSPLSRTLGKLGDHARARALTEASIEACEALGITGVNAELAYEAHVLVASEVADHAAVERCLARCSARFRRDLERRSRSSGADATVDGGEITQASLDSLHDLASSFSTYLLDCGTASECAERGLGLLVQHLNLAGGSVYLGSSATLEQVAALGDIAADPILKPWAQRKLQQEESRQHTAILTQDMADRIGPADGEDRGPESALDSYTPILLAHYDASGYATTGIMVLRGAVDTHLREAAQLGAELSLRLSQLTSGPRSMSG